ncbi:TPA: hypothetical protein ACKONR_001178 [Clostridioides difficile]|uniref:hypothetical protein n=1 Tax=Clostridioides difficile TaxID=1496 RepID=UPI00097FD651|nr:hypothetical protein [Clostridioides difficile]AXU29200.1 hypothetical protein CDIF102859_03537 [Clostridioides difficile]AXU32988.1 hypothetical protein CDIF102860_03552 [Clostridioides difficile]AXU36776.1 hypothetical protein CDIF102978_03552 [Clostridioides difficile]MCP8413129.1 hypothetical protein [Clostridioides difficile]MDC9390864.1 hypothetical protein [Clostridioides difficile]
MDNKVIKPQNSFIYKIECDLIEDDEIFVIKGNLDKEDINELIFYLQVEFRNILDRAILIPYDISNILTKLYGFEEVENIENISIEQTIELTENIDENIDKIDKILENKSNLYVDGLYNMLEDIKLEIVQDNPTVFEEEYAKLQDK